MTYEQRDMEGALFTNNKKERESQPDRNGYVVIEGRKLWISGWLKNPGTDKQFLSLACKWADEGAKEIRGRAEGRRDQQPLDYDNDGEIPF